MMELTSHVVTESDKSVKVKVMDQPHEKSKAHHQYVISVESHGEVEFEACKINFQKGPVHENKLNGITNESLLAVVMHRLECFQSSDYNCYQNEEALNRIREAMEYLEDRTKGRMKRGVEGTEEL